MSYPRLALLYLRPYYNLTIVYLFIMQFEDFANHNAFDLLARYGTTHLVFNDDIQVVLFDAL